MSVTGTGVCARVSLEVESVVESLATKCAQVSLDVAVALGVSAQYSLLWKRLGADATAELIIDRLLSCAANQTQHAPLRIFNTTIVDSTLRPRHP